MQLHDKGSLGSAQVVDLGAQITALLGAHRAALVCVLDPAWYLQTQVGYASLAEFSEADALLEAALGHYMSEGARQGLNPGPGFDTQHYLISAGETFATMGNPLVHYLTHGVRHGYSHHPLVHIQPVLTRADLGLEIGQALQEGRVTESPLFQADHYGASLGLGGTSKQPAIVDYLRAGWDAAGAPHPLFDGEFYKRQVPTPPAGMTPLQHYLTVGSAKGLMPHPLFDPAFYRQQTGLTFGIEPLLHFVTQTGDYAQPHPLFDVRRYMKDMRRNRATARVPAASDNPLIDYVLGPVDNAISPHPLFDARYYLAQFKEGDRPAAPPLIDFIKTGWRQDRRPLPLFDPRFYAAHVGAERLANLDPLTHYVAREDRGDPNYLFLEGFYRRVVGLSDSHRPGLDHYVSIGAKQRLQPHPLFQPHYYAKQCKQEGEEVDKVADLLSHYLTEGCRVPLSPLPFFDPEYYARRAGLTAGKSDAFEHYMTGGFRTLSPHPAIDLSHYAKHVPGFRADIDPVIWHILDTPKERRVSPHPAFVPEHYLSTYKDIRDAGMCPVLHFLEYGIHERRVPNNWFSHNYVSNTTHGVSFANESPVYEYFAKWHDRVHLVFVSHEATRTGAPGIILRLIEEFARLENVECLTILDRGGERFEEFKRTSHVYMLSKSVHDIGDDHPAHHAEIEQVLRSFGNGAPTAAIVNSAESRHVAWVLDRLHVPIIWLVHEMASFYSPELFSRIYETAELVVMPSRFVRESSSRYVAEPPGKVVVKGQGLLTEGFGDIDRDEARRAVLRELDLPSDAFIVVGCGTLDQRKGIDYFVGAARSFIGQAPVGGRPAYFIWVGDGPRWTNSPYYFANDEIVQAGLEDQIRFIGPRKSVEPYFVAGDAFLMTSRADPFPCVIHEAMAAELPIIGFSNAGGAPELYELGGGSSAPLGRVEEMAARLMELYSSEDKRQLIGSRSREVVLNDWSFDNYFKFFVREIEKRSQVTLMAPEKEVQTVDLLLVKGMWSPSRHGEVVSLLNQLTGEGFTASILLPHGRFTQHSGELPVDEFDGISVRYLQPPKNTPDALREELAEHLRRIKTRLIVVESDDVAATYSKELREHAPVVGIVDGKDEESLSQGYVYGRFWDLIIARSAEAAAELGTLNPGLNSKIAVIEPTIGIKPRSARFLAEKLEKLPASPLVTCVGTISTNIARRRFEQAILALAKAVPDGRFRLFLDGDEAATVSSMLIHRLGANRVSRTHGWHERQVLSTLRMAIGFMSASEGERGDKIVASAMGHGCIPIVPGQVADELAELIDAGKLGYYRGKGSYEDFAAEFALTLADRPKLASAVESVHASAVAAERAHRRAAHKLRNRVELLRNTAQADKKPGSGAA